MLSMASYAVTHAESDAIPATISARDSTPRSRSTPTLAGLQPKLPGNQTIASRVLRATSAPSRLARRRAAPATTRTPLLTSRSTRSGESARTNSRCGDEKYRSYSVGTRTAWAARANATRCPRPPTCAMRRSAPIEAVGKSPWLSIRSVRAPTSTLHRSSLRARHARCTPTNPRRRRCVMPPVAVR